MALLDLEGFNLYTGWDSSMTPRWGLVGLGYLSTGRRAGCNALFLGHGYTPSQQRKSLAATSELITGVAVYLDVANYHILEYVLGTGEQISVRTDSNNQLYVSRNGTTLWSSGTDPAYKFLPGFWYYLEFKALIHTSTGSWSLRVNGANSTLVSQTNVNTAGQGGTTLDGMWLMAPGTGSGRGFTDLYLCDTTGGAPYNALLGDCRVDPLRPTANGTHSDFSKSTGTDTYALVDDIVSDGDSTYIYDNTVGHLATVNLANLAYTPSAVYGLMVADYSKNDDSGAREIAPVLRSGGSDYVGTSHALTTSYQPSFSLYSLNPDTAAQFTPSEINALEIGVKVTV